MIDDRKYLVLVHRPRNGAESAFCQVSGRFCRWNHFGGILEINPGTDNYHTRNDSPRAVPRMRCESYSIKPMVWMQHTQTNNGTRIELQQR